MTNKNQNGAAPLQASIARNEEQEFEKLRNEFSRLHQETEKAAHALFAALPVGPERIRASDVYENIRNATRV